MAILAAIFMRLLPFKANDTMARSAVLATALVCWFGIGSCLAEEPSAKEYQLKAAFLYNFTKFVGWPSNDSENANAPFVLGVAGNVSCAAELEQIVKDRKVNGREFVVRTVVTPAAASGVHVLFLCGSEDARLEQWLAVARRAALLTGGGSEAFIKTRGSI